MLGAYNLLSVSNGYGLSFRIKGSKCVNYIKIVLNGMDLYDMEFGKVWGTKYNIIANENDVYFDMLHSLIEKHTKLYTRL
jgi:hypothetical protein